MDVIDIFERMRGTEGQWSAWERSELARLKSAFGPEVFHQTWEEGITDRGEPWLVAVDEAEHELVLHVARLDGQYVALDGALGTVSTSPNLKSVVNACVTHIDQVSRNEGLAMDRSVLRMPAGVTTTALAVLVVEQMRDGAFWHDEGATDTAETGRSARQDRVEALSDLLEETNAHATKLEEERVQDFQTQTEADPSAMGYAPTGDAQTPRLEAALWEVPTREAKIEVAFPEPQTTEITQAAQRASLDEMLETLTGQTDAVAREAAAPSATPDTSQDPPAFDMDYVITTRGSAFVLSGNAGPDVLELVGAPITSDDAEPAPDDAPPPPEDGDADQDAAATVPADVFVWTPSAPPVDAMDDPCATTPSDDEVPQSEDLAPLTAAEETVLLDCFALA